MFVLRTVKNRKFFPEPPETNLPRFRKQMPNHALPRRDQREHPGTKRQQKPEDSRLTGSANVIYTYSVHLHVPYSPLPCPYSTHLAGYAMVYFFR
jgi:hypothetical protein